MGMMFNSIPVLLALDVVAPLPSSHNNQTCFWTLTNAPWEKPWEKSHLHSRISSICGFNVFVTVEKTGSLGDSFLSTLSLFIIISFFVELDILGATIWNMGSHI